MIISLSDAQVAILRDLLDFNIENLIDEPDDSPRGEQCRDSQAIFDQLYSKESALLTYFTPAESSLMSALLDAHLENLREYDLAGVDQEMAEDLKVAEGLSGKLK